uniref:(northern house mosquito) hypothetical protein n=1 Tax=Culex pipiens TaxID=7175 RepID=A0A8D8FG79_CULPI
MCNNQPIRRHHKPIHRTTILTISLLQKLLVKLVLVLLDYLQLHLRTRKPPPCRLHQAHPFPEPIAALQLHQAVLRANVQRAARFQVQIHLCHLANGIGQRKEHAIVDEAGPVQQRYGRSPAGTEAAWRRQFRRRRDHCNVILLDFLFRALF